MGRYYSGDIQGKMWLGVQGSNDADFFGATGYQPERLEYFFDKDEHMEEVEAGIGTCIEKLGIYLEKLEYGNYTITAERKESDKYDVISLK